MPLTHHAQPLLFLEDAPGVTPPSAGLRHKFATASSSEEVIARALAEHHRLDRVDLDRFPVDPDAVALLEGDAARRIGAVPILVLHSGEVVVATHDPEALGADVGEVLDRDVRYVIATRTAIAALLDEAAPSGVTVIEPEREPAPAADTAGLEADLAAAWAQIATLNEKLAAAERHGAGMTAAAEAANGALAQLAQASAEPDAEPARVPAPPVPAPAAETVKVRGLRRMIAALRRS